MEELLRSLRSLREEKGISLREISKATRIPLEKLEALENADMEKLPEPIFIIGYVEKYLEFLGVDPEEIIGELKKYLNERKQEIIPPPLKVVKEKEKEKRYINYFLPILFIIFVMMVYHLSVNKQRVAKVASHIVKIKKIKIPAEEKIPERVKIKSFGDCWIRYIDAEGKLKEFFLRKGDSIEEKLPILLRAGNAGALTIEINGKSYKKLGRSGEVANFSIDTSGIRRVGKVPEVLKIPFPKEK